MLTACPVRPSARQIDVADDVESGASIKKKQ